ncbi:hypothetical protein ACL598_17065 [Bordetella bronchialis]|uniref:hypothetical protein n=1 Tax=Bordetella bronchialis TaxID=463025 RepID=UPI003D063E7C
METDKHLLELAANWAFFLPTEGSAVRFVTTLWPDRNLRGSGIDGYFRQGKFWSADMADHWEPHEIDRWEHRAAAAMGERDGTS